MTQLDQLQPLTETELARLAVYKAAVAAGFYTDAVVERPAVAGFSSQEVARLMVYKAAVANGFYTDWP
jgi:hypothetical protein